MYAFNTELIALVKVSSISSRYIFRINSAVPVSILIVVIIFNRNLAIVSRSLIEMNEGDLQLARAMVSSESQDSEADDKMSNGKNPNLIQKFKKEKANLFR